MRVESFPEVLLDKTERGFEAAVDETLERAAGYAPRLSGEYAASLRRSTTETGPMLRAQIGSPLPQAGAVERGADVGPRRGPHMRGAFAIGRAIEQYPDAVTRRLREQS